MKPIVAFFIFAVATASALFAATEETRPDDPFFYMYHPLKAPEPTPHFLKPHARLAICGDSITEQKKYSRIMETYLTVCAPDLDVSVRQYGWSGEKADGFLRRMTNDCLRFDPTIATTCYGMNDHQYRAYNNAIGAAYRSNSTAIVEAFKAHGVQVVEGSPGCVGKTPSWTGDKNAIIDQLNYNLCQLRNIGVEIAAQENVGFADVFWPMLKAGFEAQKQYGTNFTIAGKDGVHPDWAGHLVMAYAFLHSFGLDGEIGTFTVDLKSNKAKLSAGHDLVSFKDGELQITSHRYPFCIGEGDVSKPDNILAGTKLVPFNEELNRMTLIVKNPSAKSYKVTWGDQTKSFTADQLQNGINLSVEFLTNPFSDAFKKVDDAVAAKQTYETKEIKALFHPKGVKPDMGTVAPAAEKDREPLVAAVKAAFVPVTHTIKIVAE
jgi:lysophospholipase L1-like esterase